MLLPMYVNNELRPVRYKDLKDEIELHKLREQNRKAEDTKRVDYSNPKEADQGDNEILEPNHEQ